MINLETVSEGLEKGEFFLEYLPICSLKSKTCVGAEALLRWKRGDDIISPATFIPMIENTHLSGFVTYWVIDKIAEELGHWLERHDHVFLSINVPPEILGRGGLEYVATKNGLKHLAHKVVLEITERSVPDTIGVHALGDVQSAGVRIALDDVGVSDGSLIVLSRVHVDMIKIDKSLVNQLAQDTSPPWLKALELLMTTSPLTIVVEGVETAEQAQKLESAGIELAQGWHFSKPLKAEAFERFFDESLLVNGP